MTKPVFLNKRTYVHFDLVRSNDFLNLFFDQSVVEKNIKQHSFYPFLKFVIKQGKIKKIDGKVKFKIKERDIMYAAHLDSAIYAWYGERLSIIYEGFVINNNLDTNVLAFRKTGKSNIDFAYNVFQEISSRGDCAAICLDVKGFFDNLNHDYLKERWSELLGVMRLDELDFKIFKNITNFSYVYKDLAYEKLDLNTKIKIHRLCSPEDFRRKIRSSGAMEINHKKVGIPQGSPISALLSNVYMMKFDLFIKKMCDSMEASYFRYCDDIMIVSDKVHIKKIEKEVVSEINKIFLEVQHQKTERVFFKKYGLDLICDRPLRYLGFVFDGKRILIRESTIGRFAKKLRYKNTFGDERRVYFRKRFSRMSTHHGKRNFHSYCYRASKITGSKDIRRQIRPFWLEYRSKYKNP